MEHERRPKHEHTTSEDADPRGKISETLLEFVRPYLEEEPTVESLRAFLTLGMVAWNNEVMDGAYSEEISRRLDQDETTGPQARALMDALAARKRQVFPDDDRLIADCDVVETESGGHVVRAVAAGKR